PFFNSIPLADLGVEFIEPPVAVAHPLEDAPAAVLYRSADQTAAELFEDAVGYQRMMAPLLEDWKTIYTQIAGSLLRLPKSPVAFSRFATRAMLSAAGLANKHLRSERAKALWAGIAAHSML